MQIHGGETLGDINPIIREVEALVKAGKSASPLLRICRQHSFLFGYKSCPEAGCSFRNELMLRCSQVHSIFAPVDHPISRL